MPSEVPEILSSSVPNMFWTKTITERDKWLKKHFVEIDRQTNGKQNPLLAREQQIMTGYRLFVTNDCTLTEQKSASISAGLNEAY